MSFQRRQEDFACEHCGVEVKGDGYTNHCPSCLWSKHVDIMPGDRAEACGGMMEPVAVDASTREWRLLHRCERCRFERRNRVSTGDAQEALIALARKAAA